jgi:hypothetical protein
MEIPGELMRRLVSACGVAVGAWLLIGAVVTHAQWLNYQTPGVPRNADGSPRLDAPTPRAFDGHPDLSGVWMHDLTPLDELRRLFGDFIDAEIRNELPGMEGRNFHKYALNVLADFPGDQSPARPETKKAFEESLANPPPQALCDDTGLPFGFPLPGLLSEPIKLVQAPRVTMVLYEVGGNFRQIYADGRKLPTEVNLPAYFGYSVGRWDRDTFVVETTGFNTKAPLDGFGHPHSDQLHITERFRRRDFGHLDTEMTYDDPKMYTRPFTIAISYHLLADQDIFEMFSENEKDCAHIRKK